MKKLLLSTLTVLITMLISCGNRATFEIKVEDGITICKNKSSDLKLPIELTRISEINKDNKIGIISSFYPDKNGNIFLIDNSEKKIKAINEQGKQISEFGKIGSGPGEYMLLTTFMLINDQIFVPDIMSKRIVQYDYSGNFIKFMENIASLPSSVQPVSKWKAAGFLTESEFKDDGLYYTTKLSIFDTTFYTSHTFYQKSEKLDPEKMLSKNDDTPLFAVGDSNIYLAKASDTEFEISVFDFTGQIKRKILKNYLRAEYTKEEIADYQKKIDKKMEGKVAVGSIKFNRKTKNSITWIGVDKNNNIWVKESLNASAGNKSRINIFKHDGVLLGCLDHVFGGDLSLANGKLYLFDADRNVIEIYNYKIGS